MSDNCCLEDSLLRYVGQTVTIYTTSGGCSGDGFTGVLAFVGNGCIKLITCIGGAPACAIGSTCNCNHKRYDYCCCEKHEHCGHETKKHRNENRWGNFGWSNCGWGGHGKHDYCKNDKKEHGHCECHCNCECCCDGYYGASHGNNLLGGGYYDASHGNNWLGSVTEIPIDKIASFTHNAI